MRIVPRNPNYPRRIAKLYTKQLISEGYDFKFCFLLEAVAKMRSHRNHNELLDTACALAPTPPNGELSEKEVEERYRTMTGRLSATLGLLEEVALSLVERYDPVTISSAAGDDVRGVSTVGEAHR